MRKVIYVNGIDDDLTIGKVYDVYEVNDFFGIETLRIVNDNGEKIYYLTNIVRTFIDITDKYRSDIIDDILN